MGNCQAAEAATVLLHHSDGKVDKFYWSLSANQVMADNPGHYVAIIITTKTVSNNNDNLSIAVKHLKLLRPDDTLRIGHVYRLVSFEEVLREFASKNHVKLSKFVVNQHKTARKHNSRRLLSSSCTVGGVTVSSPVSLKDVERRGVGRDGQTTAMINTTDNNLQSKQEQENEDENELDSELEEVVQSMVSAGNSRSRSFYGQWKPTLKSISEVEIN